MEFNVNHPLIFVIVGIIIAVVLAQSIFFLVRALRRAKEIGMDKAVIKKTITGSAVFTIAPAVAILVGVLVLSKSLGVAVPWLRLSIIGSLSYENIAAGTALKALDESYTLATVLTNPDEFVTVVFVMTAGIASGLILVPLFTKRISGGIGKLEKRDKKWADILSSAMFMGMISAFVGYVFCDVYYLWNEEARVKAGASATSGLVPVLTMMVSALVMVGLGLLSKKTNKRWITDYALPISLITGMLCAVPFTILLG